MSKFIAKTGKSIAALLLYAGTAMAQTTATDTATEFKPSGKLWGYAFGDLAYKGSGDTANGGGRGGSNQYTKDPVGVNMFQFRRIYLGYNYDISKKFSAEFLLAGEDDFASGVLGQGTGDVLADNKFSVYIKLANIRWKNIYKGADLVIGQSATPAFQISESTWGYRSIERTVSDIRRTPSFDMGAALHGRFDKDANYGYSVMVANGQSARPENDAFKWFYGDLWAKFMNKKIIVDLYQDYQKVAWGVYVKGNNGPLRRDRAMTKLFAAYTTPKLTVGFEGFMNTLMGDLQVTGKDGNTYYRTTQAMALSFFVKGQIKKDKLGYFARYDNYDPSGNLSSVVNDAALNAVKYTALTSQYDPTTKEQFLTFGLDFTPIKNVHIMPNVWVNTYDCALPSAKYSLNSAATGAKGTDAVYRLTFYYVYGK